MALENGLCTVAELQSFMPNSSGISTLPAERAIMAASSEICKVRQFYPSVAANLYDVPSGRTLKLWADLLEVLTLTNGDSTVLTTADYYVSPSRSYPKWDLVINDVSTLSWQGSAAGKNELAISVLGLWGYRENYAIAWALGANLAAAITTTTETSISGPSSTAYASGNIVRCDNELMLVTAAGASTITVVRGWNGSTAATHLIAAPVKIWKPEPDVIQACLIQSARLYRRGEAVFGTTGGGEMGVQPVSIPALDPDVQRIVNRYQRQI
jgi:hypothetical protein